MAITQVLKLPAQPSSGSAEIIPLGGNGWISPQSAFLIDMQVTGDATGGRITLTVERDNRFEHLISLIQLNSDDAAAAEFLFGIHRGKVVAQASGTQTNIGLTSLDNNQVAWNPTPMISPTKWTCVMNNVDTIEYKWLSLVYNFKIQASEKIPLSVLFSSLPRSASLI